MAKITFYIVGNIFLLLGLLRAHKFNVAQIAVVFRLILATFAFSSNFYNNKDLCPMTLN